MHVHRDRILDPEKFVEIINCITAITYRLTGFASCRDRPLSRCSSTSKGIRSRRALHGGSSSRKYDNKAREFVHWECRRRLDVHGQRRADDFDGNHKAMVRKRRCVRKTNYRTTRNQSKENKYVQRKERLKVQVTSSLDDKKKAKQIIPLIFAGFSHNG